MTGQPVSEDAAAPTRTGWDLVLGALLVLAGIVVLGHTVIATVISVLFLGWLALAAGLVEMVASLFKIGRERSWVAVLGGGLIGVLGLVMIRNPGIAAVSITLVAGAMFLATGVARLVAAFQIPQARVALLIGGGVSTLLGLLVLFNLVEATLTLLGVMLGVQAIAEGVAIMVAGREAVRASRMRGVTGSISGSA